MKGFLSNFYTVPTRLPAGIPRAAASHPAERLEALFDAILVNDRIDRSVSLPTRERISASQEELRSCFSLARQLWHDQFDRSALCAMLGRIMRGIPADAADRLALKHARARFKHLRFAFVNFDARRRYPPALHRLTRLMGALQDALKLERSSTRHLALLLRILLWRLPFRLIEREVERFRSIPAVDFTANVTAEIAGIGQSLAAPHITGHDFHDMRRVIGRQVAFYDDLRTIRPTAFSCAMSRYLASLNGMMGAYHDLLIEQRISGQLDYRRDPIDIPSDIRDHLKAFVAYHAPR